MVFTGAGISTESGIPDFRSADGLWSRFQPVTIQEFLYSDDARRRYWQYKRATWPLIAAAQPNPGHRAICELERRGQLQTLITQNIDGLHERAGNTPQLILELHGSEHFVLCLSCGLRIDRTSVQQRLDAGEEIPSCASCGGWLKPATVSFGQSLPAEVLERAFHECTSCEALLAVGSSLSVMPAAQLPVVAKRHGAWLGILNREPTPLDDLADWVCHESAGAVLAEAVGGSELEE